MTTQVWFRMCFKIMDKLNWQPHNTYFYPEGWWLRVRKGENPPMISRKSIIYN